MKNKPIHVKPSLYAFYFEVIKEIGFKYGYNIVLHGSLNRDLDLICLPWITEIQDVDTMIDEIATTLGGQVMMQNREVNNLDGDRFSLKPHGRKAYIININRDFKLKYDGIKSEQIEVSHQQYYLDISVF